MPIFFKSPITIACLIALVGVNPSQVCVDRSYPHILKKSLKFFPATTEQTSLFPVRPTAISACLAHPMGLWSTMGWVPTNRTVPFVTFAAVFTPRYPSDVTWFVVFGMINSSQRITWTWTWTKIGKEGRKSLPLPPRCVDTDPLRAPSGIVTRTLVVASILHRCPSTIFRAMRIAFAMTMPRPLLCYQFPFFTPATLGQDVAQNLSTNGSLSATNATAEPRSSTRGRRSRASVTQNLPKPESFAG